MPSAGAISVDVKANTAPFEQGMRRLGDVAKGLMGPVLGAVSAAAVLKFGKECTDVASDLTEVQNVVDVTFKSMSGAVDEWAKSAIDSFGLSETMAKQYAGTLGSMAEAFGFSEREAYDMGTTLAGLAGDVASFYNMSQDEAFGKLKSVFTGETESLKQLGVVMTQTALDQFALANGFGATTAQMTEAEKVSLRYAFVQQQLSNATGDFARTSGSWANQVRLLSLRFQQFKAAVGQALIAALLPVVKVLNAVVQAATNAANAFLRIIEAVTGRSMAQLTGQAEQVSVDLGDVGAGASDAAGALGDLADAQGGAADAAKAQDAAQKALNRTLAGFDKITRLSSESSASGGSGGSGGGGTGGGVSGGGGSGGVGLGSAVEAEASKATDALSKIKLPENLLAAFERVRAAAAELASTISEGLGWAYENVLKPLGEFTISTVLPDVLNLLADALGHVNDFCQKIADPMSRFLVMCEKLVEFAWTEALQPLLDFATNEVMPRVLDAVATAFDVIVTVLEKLKPVAQWLWENVVKPLAELLGDVLLAALDKLNEALDWLLDEVSKADFGPFLDNLSKMKDWLGDKLTKAAGAAKEAIAALKEGLDAIKSKAVELTHSVKEKAAGALDRLREAWDAVKDKTAELVMAAKQTVAAVKSWYEDRAAEWKNKASELAMAASTAASTVRAWFSERASEWHDKAASLSMAASTAASAVATWCADRLREWKDGSADLTLKAAQTVSDVAKWLRERAAEWKDKIAELSFVLKTPLDTIKKWWNDMSAVWKGKSVDLEANDKTSGTIGKVKTALGGLVKKVVDITANNKTGTGVSAAKKTLKKVKSRKVNLTAANKTSAGVKSARNTVNGLNGRTVNLYADNYVSSTVSSAQRSINGLYGKTVTLNAVTKVSGVKDLQLQLDATNSKYTWTPHYFAQGGWVARNTPMLAVVGDNRREGEIISPESKFQSMLDKAAGTTDVAALLPVLNDILNAIQSHDGGVYLDGREITRAVVSNVNAQIRATGRSPILV